MGLNGQEIFLILLAIVLLGVPWLWALADILRSKLSGTSKLVWLVVVCLWPLVGVTLYFFIGRKKKA